MQKKNLILTVLFSLFIITGGTSAYLLNSNSVLRANLTEAQNEAENEIESLKQQIEKIKEAKVNSNNAISNQNSEKNSSNEAEEILTNSPVESTTPPPVQTTNIETPQTGPILTATPEVFDLGTISKQNGIVTASFELKNSGNTDLSITYAFTSCGCTVAPIKEEKILRPGEIYQMDVTYDPNFYGPAYELGNIEKTVTIISNDSGKPFYKVKLRANVVE